MLLNRIMHFINKKNSIYFIIGMGLLIRLLFFLFGASHYFPRENFMLDGDSAGWMKSIEHLIHNGVYTINPSSEFGYFSRMPGYSFFIGIFYLISGHNWDIAIHLIVWCQIFLDAFAIYLVYRIIGFVSSNKTSSIIGALIYATYPFIIVWNPVVYSESFSVFVMLLALFFIFKPVGKVFYYVIGGWFAGIAVLCRPQLSFLLVTIFLYFFLSKPSFKWFLKISFFYGIGLLFSYGLWPIRNIAIHGEYVFLEDLRAYNTYGKDVVAFRSYVYSLKPEWEPQFSQILNQEEVKWPSHAFISPGDSILLSEMTEKAKYCTDGFSWWKGYKGTQNIEGGCKDEVTNGFTILRKNQIKANPFNYYFKVPLLNLKKAVFKNQLSSVKSSAIGFVSSMLFGARTILLILGVLSSLVLLIKYKQKWVLIPFIYGVGLYLILCFGPATHFRNIEMRYFLHADILFLIPFAILFGQYLERKTS